MMGGMARAFTSPAIPSIFFFSSSLDLLLLLCIVYYCNLIKKGMQHNTARELINPAFYFVISFYPIPSPSFGMMPNRYSIFLTFLFSFLSLLLI